MLPGLEDIRPVEVNDLQWLVEHGTAQFGRPAAPNGNAGTYNGIGNGALDQSRSGVAYRRAATFRENGIDNYADFRDAMLADPMTADWALEKGLVNHERELHRLFDRVKFSPFVAEQLADLRRQIEEEKAKKPTLTPRHHQLEAIGDYREDEEAVFFDEYENLPEINYWDRETKLAGPCAGRTRHSDLWSARFP